MPDTGSGRKVWNMGAYVWNRVAHKFGTNVAGPGDEDDMIGYSEQIQLANMQASGALRQPRSSTGGHICKLGLQGIAKNRFFVTCSCNIKQSTELEGHSPAYNRIICAGPTSKSDKTK